MDSIKKADESELNGSIERAVERVITEVVERAVAPIEGEERRLAVREGVTTILRETFAELAVRPDLLFGGADDAQLLLGGTDVSDSGAAFATGVAQLTPSFVEFTSGLITGTFDALIAATVKQMEAYAALVADLAKTLDEFSQANVTDAQVFNFLVQRWPNPRWTSGEVASPMTKVSADYAWAEAELTEFKEQVAAATKIAPSSIPETSGKLATGTVGAIYNAVRSVLGKDLMDHLRAMAREGMARIVVTNGEILTKLTFQMTATELQQSVRSQYDRLSAHASISAGARAPWGSVKANAGIGKLSVRAINEQSFDSSTMTAELIGQVKIMFKTETFPPIDVPPAAEPAG